MAQNFSLIDLPKYVPAPGPDFTQLNQGLRYVNESRLANLANDRAERGVRLQEKKFSAEEAQAARDRIGKRSSAILELERQGKTAEARALHARYMSDPRMVQAAKDNGLDPTDHVSMARAIVAEWNPSFEMEQKKGQAAIEASGASAASARAQASSTAAAERRAGEMHPIQVDALKTQVATGKWLPQNEGTVGYINPLTRETISAQPQGGESKALREARDKEIGKAQGEATTNLPKAVDVSNVALDTIKQIQTHAGRKWGTGITAAPFGGVSNVPGTDARGFANLVDQAKGQTFLAAFEALRGGGAISEKEGQAATTALARLDRAQSKKDFDAALGDLEKIIRTGQERARRMAKGDFSAASPGSSATGAGSSAAPRRLRYNPETGALE